MSYSESFSDPTCIDQIDIDCTQLAERELSAFIVAVTDLFGPEQARAAAEDWLEELEHMDNPPRTARDWHAVSIAASARLTSRIDAARYRQKNLSASPDTEVPTILWSNCFAATLLF